MSWEQVVIALVSGGLVTALAQGWLNRKRVAAEAHSLEAEALNRAASGYAQLLSALTQQQNETSRRVAELLTRLTEAEREIKSLRDENTNLRAEIARLQAILFRAGIDPDSGECLKTESP